MKKKGMHRLFGLCMAAVTAAGCLLGTAEVKAEEKLPVLYKDGIHYINSDPDWPGANIVLFCMNNTLNWPHYVPQMGDSAVPDYTKGYLTEKDFRSKEEYEECMHRLARLLYVGYPYNGEHLYKVVEEDGVPLLSKSEFDHLLKVTPELAGAFPYLDGRMFSYGDWEKQNKEDLDLLVRFLADVGRLSISGGTTANGLKYTELMAMPFYKAAYCMVSDTGQDPLHTFAATYGDEYYVTKTQAYDATQNAVWKTLTEYGIPDNNIETLQQPLSVKLYERSLRGDVLRGEPDIDRVKLTGDMAFTYNGEDGMWHTGEVYVEEPKEYHGKYELAVPEGMQVIADDDTVYGNQEFEIVSDHKPEPTEGIDIDVEFHWLQDMKQYSPADETTLFGKKFQHMIGAVILHKTVSSKYMFVHEDVGSLAVTKTVEGKDSAEDFHFTVELSDHTLNGKYGDVTLAQGKGSFTLKAGETKALADLPVGISYVIKEAEAQGYHTVSERATGTVKKDETITVSFVNTWQPTPPVATTPTPSAPPKPDDKKPATGVDRHLSMWTLIMAASAGLFLIKK